MKLCRFQLDDSAPRIGLVADDRNVLDLAAAGVDRLTTLLEAGDLAKELTAFSPQKLPHHALADVKLLTPVEQQEVWAAGVTYLRSKKARLEESDFSANAY